MNTFRRSVWAVDWLVAVVAGFLGILWYIDPSNVDWLRAAGNHTLGALVFFVAALISVLLNISYLVVRYVHGYPLRTHIPVKGGDSNITVSLQALQNSLMRALKREPEVCDVTVELEHDRKRRRIRQVRARGTIYDGPDILQTTLKMQKVLEQRFREIVDPQEAPEFEVKLDSLRFVGKPKKFRERIDRIKESFRGPEYPIGG